MACQLVSRSVSYFGLGAASRSCNNRAAEGRAGGEALKACPRAGRLPAAVMRKRSIRGLSVLHSYHKLLRAASVPFVVRARASVRRAAAALVVREAVKWDLNHDVAVVVWPRRSFLTFTFLSLAGAAVHFIHPPLLSAA